MLILCLIEFIYFKIDKMKKIQVSALLGITILIIFLNFNTSYIPTRNIVFEDYSVHT